VGEELSDDEQAEMAEMLEQFADALQH